ncbi:MAG: hypothetical protein HY471_02450 [Candidatus Sungbacteria bacterium]|nr:hypothetical protein [Candidatus Sungbacteria bacterium]
MKLCLFFGTSTTWGAWDRKGGWVERLRAHYFKDHFIYNLGVSGDTTCGIVKRFEQEATARLEDFEYGEIIIAFSIGGNDASWLINEKKSQVSEEEFGSNIEYLYEKARVIAHQVYFLSSAPVDESKTSPLPWAPHLAERNDLKEKYAGIVKDFCVEKNIPFIDVFSSWKDQNYSVWLDDGLHPNAEGHQKIFELVKNRMNI